MSTYKFSNNNHMDFVPVSTAFINKYMPVANATYVKVYLYGLSVFFNKSNQIKNKCIANELNILESDVVNAWKYWDSVGVIKLIPLHDSESSNVNIEFLSLESYSKPEPTMDIIKPDSRPNYTPEEISIYIEQNDSIRFMYSSAQKKLGKILSSSDINTLYSFYDWLRLPIEVILMLLEYCVSINKKHIRYIETIAIDWADKGINSLEKAEKHLSALESKNLLIYNIKKHLGIYERNLSDTEESYIFKWTNEMGFNIDLIKSAYELTVLNTGKLSFPYLNSILISWHKQGIKTIKAVEDNKVQHNQKSKQKYIKASASKTAKKSNKFINFTQRDYDFNEIERLAREKTINNLKESR